MTVTVLRCEVLMLQTLKVQMNTFLLATTKEVILSAFLVFKSGYTVLGYYALGAKGGRA
jgi:hypothetical protein